MQKSLPFPTDRLRWWFHPTHSTCRLSRFHRIHPNYSMNMPLR
jgi:hypothetical protein